MNTPNEGMGLDLRDSLDVRFCRVGLPSADASYIDEGRGRTILLLHGAPLTSVGLTPLIWRLRRHFRVLAPDFPGFGGSLTGHSGPYSLGDYSDFVVEFVRELDLRDLTIFVHDSSGPIGLGAAARVSDRVAGLVIADTVPIPMVGRAALVRTVLGHVVTSAPARWVNRRMNALAWLVANVAPMHRRLPKQLRSAMVAEFGCPDRRERTMDVFEALATDQGYLQRTADAVASELGGVPALILYGQFDPMRFAGGGARYRAMFPRSRNVVIPLEEHFPMLGSAGAVAKAIRSWISVELPSSVEPSKEPQRG